MQVPNSRSRGSVGFNMTPMIDVVFLLIIFFLVSSHLVKQEIQMEMDLPEATTGHATEEEDQTRRVVVNVLADEQPQGQMVVSGRPMHAAQLAQLIAFESEQAKQRKRNIEVRIRSDRKVPYRVVEPIMVACARSGVWRVTFAVVGD